MAEQALVGGQARRRTLDLPLPRLASKLPHDLADLRERLSRHRLAEASQPTRGVDRDAAADRRVTVVQQAFGLTRLAQADVLVPVELERTRQVVDLGERQV